MKNALMLTAILSFFSMNAGLANSMSQQVAAIETIVESVAVLADSGNFEVLEKLYADEVLIDYSSLTGVDPQLKSPQALMTEWAGVLPGFDRTRHRVSNIKVTLESENRAVATADVVADHYVGELHWQVSGDYRYELAVFDRKWLITAATFNLTDEQGTREVSASAIQNAAVRPPAYVVRKQTEDAVHLLLSAFEAVWENEWKEQDLERLTAAWDRMVSVWDDNAVYERLHDPAERLSVTGKENIIKTLEEDWLQFQWPEFSFSIYPMQNPQVVFVEISIDVYYGPISGHQTRGALIQVENGKIKLYREFLYEDYEIIYPQ